MRTRYIYGVYEGHPGYPDFERTLAAAMTRARAEAVSAQSPLDYQFVIRHFLASFDDPHISVDFNTSTASWPSIEDINTVLQARKLPRSKTGPSSLVVTAGLPTTSSKG